MRIPTSPGWKWEWCPKYLLRERTVWRIVLSYKTCLWAHYQRRESDVSQWEHALVQSWKSNVSMSQRLCKPGQNEAMLGCDELLEKQRTHFMSLIAFWSCWDSSLLGVSLSSNSLCHTARRIAYVMSEDWSLVIPVIPPRKEMLCITIPCSLVDCWATPPWNLCGRAWEIPPMWVIYPAGRQALWQLLVVSEPVPEERTLLASLLCFSSSTADWPCLDPFQNIWKPSIL